MSEETKNKAIQIAGDGTNRDGETMNVSVDGYNVTLVNKGGVWVVSSFQKVLNDAGNLKWLDKSIEKKESTPLGKWLSYTGGLKQRFGI